MTDQFSAHALELILHQYLGPAITLFPDSICMAVVYFTIPSLMHT